MALYNYGDVLCFTQDNRRIAYDWEAMKGESGDGRELDRCIVFVSCSKSHLTRELLNAVFVVILVRRSMHWKKCVAAAALQEFRIFICRWWRDESRSIISITSQIT